MNNFIKDLITEKIMSKSDLDGKVKNILSKKSGKKKKTVEVDEVVDEKGNLIKGKKPANLNTKTITSNSTSDEVAKTGAGQMGDATGTYGSSVASRRFWGESDMSNALGFEDTIGQDEDYEAAKKHFKEDLGLDDIETEERLAQLGYDKKLPDDKLRLVENPKKFVEEYLESILDKRNIGNDIIDKESEEIKEVNPIILKQIKALKNTLNSNKLSVSDILRHLKDNE